MTFLALFAAALSTLWLLWKAMGWIADWIIDWIESRLCR